MNAKIKRRSPIIMFIQNGLLIIGPWMVAVLYYKIIWLYGVESIIEATLNIGHLKLHIIYILVGGFIVKILFGILKVLLHRSGLSDKRYVQVFAARLITFFVAISIAVIAGRMARQLFDEKHSIFCALNKLPSFLILPFIISHFFTQLERGFDRLNLSRR